MLAIGGDAAIVAVPSVEQDREDAAYRLRVLHRSSYRKTAYEELLELQENVSFTDEDCGIGLVRFDPQTGDIVKDSPLAETVARSSGHIFEQDSSRMASTTTSSRNAMYDEDDEVGDEQRVEEDIQAIFSHLWWEV